MKNAEMMETGMATNGMMVLLQSRRNTKMINATRPNASNNVSPTSDKELRTGTVKSFPSEMI